MILVEVCEFADRDSGSWGLGVLHFWVWRQIWRAKWRVDGMGEVWEREWGRMMSIDVMIAYIIIL